MNDIFYYIPVGFTHVIPNGFDHIVFIICVFFASNSWREMILFCSAFTIAHSLSLIISLSNLINISSTLVEPLIAMTILFSALENIFQLNTNRWKPLLIFFFGLIHGLGFANSFKELNVPSSEIIQSTIGFNLGVELAQLTILFTLYYTFTKHLSKKPFYHSIIVQPIATLIACLAIFWTITRI